MDTVFLIAGLILWRVALHFLSRSLTKEKGSIWLAIIFLAIIGGALPMILIKESVLEESVVNIVIVGISSFYFAFVVGRMSLKSN